jgi:hypothetical protein
VKIAVLIEPTAEERYRASVGEPFPASVEGDSPEAVLQMVKQQIEDRVAQGAQIATLDLPNGDNPWLAGFGMFRDDPLFDEWQQAIAEYRREANQRADAP